MGNAFPNEVVRYIIFQVAGLLEHLHDEGILYRDLKASNLLLDETGVVKLVDFGLCKKIGGFKTSSICGTAHALPLEIFDTEGYGFSIDHFSLGILTFELLSG